MKVQLVRGLLALGLTATMALAMSAAPASAATTAGGSDDSNCAPSAAHPNPVVFLHGLGANKDEDINFLQDHVARRGYCTYSLTYGAPFGQTFVGGVGPVADSAVQIAKFIRDVRTQTGAAKVDLVGHSGGAFQSLYVTKTQGIAGNIGKVIAIAPPTHGTDFAGLYKLPYLLGGQASRDLVDSVLKTFGCPSCSELGIGGSAVKTLTTGPIAQSGVKYTIITSRFDELVTPTETSFVREPGVANMYVQDTCPLDPVGHLGEAYDLNVWKLVDNALDPAHAKRFLCTFGLPA